jgi:hypothetical protein
MRPVSSMLFKPFAPFCLFVEHIGRSLDPLEILIHRIYKIQLHTATYSSLNNRLIKSNHPCMEN